MRIGILALQGDVREHKRVLAKLGAEAIEVKLPQDLDDVDALIMPGGESTTIGMLMRKYKLDAKIRQKHNEGMPIYGTCAGAILLAKEIIGSKQPKLALADISVKRNDYGRQIDSFEADLSIKDIGELKGIFVRAPIIKRSYNGAEILAEYKNNPVMMRQDNILITTFHPELTNDIRIHEYFLNMAAEYKPIREARKDLEENQNTM